MTIIASDYRLLTAKDLPHSDETPVDNELQNQIPNLLLNILLDIWGDRQDWFFAVDMGVYFDAKTFIVPDGFLAIGVPRFTTDDGRLSYLTWQENNVIPILVIEVVSQKYNSEYEQKLEDYQNLGVLYYVIYNSAAGKKHKHRDRIQIQVYKLINGKYQLINGNPIWMPEIRLGIGCEIQNYGGWQREWLFWYNQDGKRYLTERESKEKLANYLKSIGVNPENIP
jgi:Uma2 family endonuclease